MSQRFLGVKGMNDLLPPQSATWQRVEALAREVFGTFGYGEVRTPVAEDTALFVRSVGETTDIVGKEMYTFDDKAGRSLTLRPEGTAPAARAFIEHGLAQQEPLTRWYYLGPMFRYERMKTGRYRQFSQVGVEAYGSADAAMDAEVIAMAMEFFSRVGLSGVRLTLNSLGDAQSRPRYLDAIRAHFAPHEASLSADARATLEKNPMRLLDSKEEALAELIKTAPVMLDFIDEASRAHFDEVKALLTALGLAFELNPRLVRGLDYYTRTAFEFISDDPRLGTASAVGGGGRYDRLVKELGGPEKPAVGFALGLDRLCLVLEGQFAAPRPALFVVTMDGPVRIEAIKQVMALRRQGLQVDFDPRGGKVKRQLERAASIGARYLVVFGDAEHQSGQLKVKLLDVPDDHPDRERTVALGDLPAWLRVNGPGAAPVSDLRPLEPALS